MNPIKKDLDDFIGETKFHLHLKKKILRRIEQESRKTTPWYHRKWLVPATTIITLCLVSVLITYHVISEEQKLYHSPSNEHQSHTNISGKSGSNRKGIESFPEEVQAKELTSEEIMEAKEHLLSLSEEIFLCLKDLNYKQLATYVHPKKPLFFSFYANVEGRPVKIAAEALAELTGKETFRWGKDHADRIYEVSIQEFIEKYLLRKGNLSGPYTDYQNINYNEATPTGLRINTIHEHYPHAVFVEYHSEAVEDLEKLHEPWQMLRFVYEMIDDEWYLIGIVRDYPEH